VTSSISVIIPAYNRADLIGETLRSLLNQTVPAKEIIVVDDGSTDSTAEVVERIAEEIRDRRSEIGQPAIKVIRQGNAGPGAARNRGLAESTGEFIHFFDSDDIAAPNKHEVQLRTLLETGADIAVGPWIKGRMDEGTAGGRRSETGDRRRVARQPTDKGPRDEGPAGDRRSETRGQTTGPKHEKAEQLKHRFDAVGPVLQARGLPEGDLVRALLTDWSIVPHACLFRRSIVERGGGFPEDIWVGEDQLMFIRCLLSGAKLVHSPGTLTYYRVGGEGKLTSVGEAQKRVAKDYARFLLKAKNELAGDSISWPLTRGLSRRLGWQSSAGQKPATRDSPLVTKDPKDPSAWFGFRLRAYEAWKDLEKFFPDAEGELKAELSKVGRFEGSKVARWKYELAGWWGRKVGGLKKRIFGYRENRSFRCEKFTPANFEVLTKETR
jgi:glycosyltransferase involved in cell wall biosynthesis